VENLGYLGRGRARVANQLVPETQRQLRFHQCGVVAAHVTPAGTGGLVSGAAVELDDHAVLLVLGVPVHDPMAAVGADLAHRGRETVSAFDLV
jgi:hypothetical protein